MRQQEPVEPPDPRQLMLDDAPGIAQPLLLGPVTRLVLREQPCGALHSYAHVLPPGIGEPTGQSMTQRNSIVTSCYHQVIMPAQASKSHLRHGSLYASPA